MVSILRRIYQRISVFFQAPGVLRRLVKITTVIVAGMISLGFIFAALVWVGFFGRVPGKKDLQKVHNPIASEVYSSDSVLLGRFYLQERSPATLAEIPETLKQALISTEDVRFYQHDGVDTRSLMRVLVKTLLFQDEGSGGGSTITQQLAKNIYPRKNYSFLSLPVNKIKEIIVARRLERLYSKDEILLLYLNTIPFADNTYGIKTASERFFSVPVNKLSVDQSAMLIGMLKATHSYNPRLFPERAMKRRNVVISQMKKYGFLTEKEKALYQSKAVVLKYNTSTSANTGLAPYFRSHLQRELLQWCKNNRKRDGNPYNLYTDGLKIYTTIDSRLQKYAEQSMRDHMSKLQDRFEKQLRKSQVSKLAKAEVRRLPSYTSLANAGMSESRIQNQLARRVSMKVFEWDGEREAKMNTIDSLRHYIQFLQAGILAMDPQLGHIRVWVGGIDHRYFKYDHVRESTKRQVGSTIKPLLYAAALEKGISPCSYVSARKTLYTNMEGWTPENTNDETYDKKYSMEGGLAGSVNTVSVKLLEKTGINYAINTVRKMGVTSSLEAVPSLALGTPSISLMEMVGAYGVLANGGKYVKPMYLLSIHDHDGDLIKDFTEDADKPQKAISENTAKLMIHMLRSVVAEGTGAALKTRFGLPNDIVGKTGTTQSNVDGWFIGILPKLVIGTWVGADNPQLRFSSTSMGQGSSTALPIVAGLIQRANKDKELREDMLEAFPPLPERLLDRVDCDRSKSDRNFFERLFNKKKKTKVTKFRKRG